MQSRRGRVGLCEKLLGCVQTSSIKKTFQNTNVPALCALYLYNHNLRWKGWLWAPRSQFEPWRVFFTLPNYGARMYVCANYFVTSQEVCGQQARTWAIRVEVIIVLKLAATPTGHGRSKSKSQMSRILRVEKCRQFQQTAIIIHQSTTSSQILVASSNKERSRSHRKSKGKLCQVQIIKEPITIPATPYYLQRLFIHPRISWLVLPLL